MPLWDAPVRLFHWALALLVVASFVSGKVGGSWMEWHVRSGYAILALLAFRLAWGVAGSSTARFSSFVAKPSATLEYARALLARRHVPAIGHNPLGGWMVLAMLAILSLQVATGLFADDEVATQGALSIFASARMVSWVNRIHEANQWVIAGAVVLHVLAIAYYQWALKSDLLGPMVHGGTMPEGSAGPRGSPVLALVLFVVACVAVYWLVVILPRSA